MLRRTTRIVTVILACSFLAGADDSGKRVFSVMTQNVDNGTDFLDVLGFGAESGRQSKISGSPSG